MEGPVKVTIEFPADPGRKPIVFEYANAHIVEERGVMPIYDTIADRVVGKIWKFVPNGHKRVCIKLWSGCPTWETFRERSDFREKSAE